MERLEDRALLANITWAGGSGDWSTPSKWIGGMVPGPSDTALIPSSNVTITHTGSGTDSVNQIQLQGANNTITVSGGQLRTISVLTGGTGNTLSVSSGQLSVGDLLAGGAFPNLSMSGGTLGVTGGIAASLTITGGTVNIQNFPSSLQVNGQTTWSGGSMLGRGTLDTRGPLTLGGSAANTNYTMTLGTDVKFINEGQAVMQVAGGNNSTQLILNSYPISPPPANEFPATFDNRSTLEIKGDNTFIRTDSSFPFTTPGTFLNEGLLWKSSGTSNVLPTVVSAAFNSPGTLKVDSGTVVLSGGGSFSSTSSFSSALQVSGGTTLDLHAGTFNVTGHLDNAPQSGVSGLITISGATLNFTGSSASYSQFGPTTITDGTFDYEAPTTATLATFVMSGANTQVIVGSGSTLGLDRFTGGTLTQNGGELDLNGGTISVPFGYTLNSGTFVGSGTINGPVTNKGSFIVGGRGTVGRLTLGTGASTGIPGTYTQTSTGSIDFDIGGTTPGTQYDQLVASTSGLSSVTGLFNLHAINGFVPATGNSFSVITGSLGYGTIQSFTLPQLGPGQNWQFDFQTAAMTFRVVAATGFGITLTPSNTSPTYGQSQSFTALVTPTQGGPIPTGTVTFFVDGTQLGSPVTLQPASFGNATGTSISTAAIGAGTHTIRVDYSGGNYPASSSSISLTVAKAHLGVVADNKTRAVGQANPPLTASFVGFVNGEDATSAQITGAPTLTTTATAGSPPDVYPITVVDAGTLSAANYDFRASGFVAGTLTVIPATSAMVVAGSTLPNSTYGQSVSFTATVSGSGTVPTGTVQFVVDGANFGDPVMLVNGVATTPATTTLSAGGHTVVARYSGDPTYGGNSDSITQQVAKASLTLVVEDKSANRFSGLPALTYKLVGFANGEDASSAGVVVMTNLTTAPNAGGAVGYYPIQATGTSLTAANYQLGGVQDGTLTVRPSVVGVRARFGPGQFDTVSVFDRDLPFLNIRAIDVVFSDDVGLSGLSAQLLGVNVPSYLISGLSYNSATRTATISLSAPIGADRLTLNLAGFTAPSSTGGPDVAAVPYSAGFAVLPGDVDGDGVVSIADAIVVRDHIQAFGGQYLIWADVDDSGIIDLTDMTAVRNRIGSVLPPA